ncbi:hypothetical protein GCM10010917_30910 [Paenibacillus physcomitrellae]|uniref:Uncharacterized protein n=1 Tax=Paenibacillus physcomitrellae TaxID=1619311 RepID=A0ABQ1GGT9_9BACL|nr:hypothetical protein GCM10010917_30910 [Paenibacillus physcomitrellae]
MSSFLFLINGLSLSSETVCTLVSLYVCEGMKEKQEKFWYSKGNKFVTIKNKLMNLLMF